MGAVHDAWLLDALGIDITKFERRADWVKPDEAADDTEASGGAGTRRRRRAPRPAVPVPRAAIGPQQTERASGLLKKMSPGDQAKVSALMAAAKGEGSAYLTKAVASAHSAAEIEAFAKEIAGKNHDWLENNLHLTGDTHGRGVKQQWESTCVPTMVEAMRGELDPVYALHMHRQNPNLTQADDANPKKLNPAMAEEQRGQLAAGGGVPTARNTPGAGMEFGGLLDQQKGSTGLSFAIHAVGGTGGLTVDQALADMDKSLAGGLPVPVRVSDAANSGGHAVLCTGVDRGPPRRYSIHDPWDGKTVVVSESDIRRDKFNIAGWNHVSHIFEPEPAK